MYSIVRASEGVIRKISDCKTATDLITKNITADFSLSITEGENCWEKGKSPYSRIYYILDGEMDLLINQEEVLLHVGDSCHIEKNTEYEIAGAFRAILVNQPAFGSLRKESGI